MDGGRNQVQPIWDDFFHNQEALVFLSEQILAEKENSTIEQKYQKELLEITDLVGETKIRAVKTRVNQYFFRQMVTVNYSGKVHVFWTNFLHHFAQARHIGAWLLHTNPSL